MTSAHAQYVPSPCRDGHTQLQNKNYSYAINLLTQCLNSPGIESTVKATAYHNRAASIYGQFLALSLDDQESDSAFDLLERAYDDADRAITLDPSYGLSYCLRGTVLLDMSWGLAEEGYDDIDKGLKLGADSSLCTY